MFQLSKVSFFIGIGLCNRLIERVIFLGWLGHDVMINSILFRIWELCSIFLHKIQVIQHGFVGTIHSYYTPIGCFKKYLNISKLRLYPVTDHRFILGLPRIPSTCHMTCFCSVNNFREFFLFVNLRGFIKKKNFISNTPQFWSRVLNFYLNIYIFFVLNVYWGYWMYRLTYSLGKQIFCLCVAI